MMTRLLESRKLGSFVWWRGAYWSNKNPIYLLLSQRREALRQHIIDLCDIR
jgi:hypothetical protein